MGVLVFGDPYCSSIDSTHFNIEHENTCSFLCHIGNSILTFRDMYLHVIVRKKNCFITFCIKLTIYKKLKFLRKTAIKISFSFTSLLYLNRETPWKLLIQKRKVAIFFLLEIFVDKAIFNFHSFNKVNDFVTTQYTTAIFYLFYLNL